VRRLAIILLALVACQADRYPPIQIFSCDTAPNVERCERRRLEILYPNPAQRPPSTMTIP
jgi:hypothetical protein